MKSNHVQDCDQLSCSVNRVQVHSGLSADALYGEWQLLATTSSRLSGPSTLQLRIGNNNTVRLQLVQKLTACTYAHAYMPSDDPATFTFESQHTLKVIDLSSDVMVTYMCGAVRMSSGFCAEESEKVQIWVRNYDENRKEELTKRAVKVRITTLIDSVL